MPAINSGRIGLLDLKNIENQLIALERRTSRAGRDIVDHPPGQHDDLANAAAGALIMALVTEAKPRGMSGTIGADGRLTFNTDEEPRIWHWGPGISAIDGKPTAYANGRRLPLN